MTIMARDVQAQALSDTLFDDEGSGYRPKAAPHFKPGRIILAKGNPPAPASRSTDHGSVTKQR
jgi:hypothetical protein